MKMNERSLVNQHIDLLYKLLGQKEKIASGRGLSVSIEGTYQDDNFVAACASVVLQQLDLRIEEERTWLAAHGVDPE